MGTAAPTPNGFTAEGFCNDLDTGRHGIKRIDSIIDGYEDVIEARIGGSLPQFVLKEMLEEAGFNVKEPNIHKETRSKWHRTSQAQVWTGAQALRQAGFLTSDSLRVDEKQVDPNQFGVYQGTGVAGFLELIEIQKILDGEGKRPQVSGHDILLFLGGRPDEITSMVFNAKAFNDTMFTECAASLSSIDRAVDELRLGRADMVLAGGVEIAAHPATIAAFEKTKAISKETNPETGPLMLYKDPDDPKIGLALGEGAGSVVLETWEHALWRQQKLGSKVVILAEILGSGKSADAYHDTAPSEDGAIRAIDQALANAGLTAEEIHDLLIEGHWTGTGGDINEFRSIIQRFKKDQLAGMSAVKVDTGHTFGAAGVLAAIAGIHSMNTNTVRGFRTMSDQNRHAETFGWPIFNGAGARKVRNVGIVMVNAFGFGGKNRVVLLGPARKI